jgi:hypothetical protein
MNITNLTTRTHRIRYATATGTYALVASFDGTPRRGRAGMAIGEMWLRRGADLEPMDYGVGLLGTGQDIPADEQQYAFTHGGEEYRAACRAVWAALQALHAGLIVVPPTHSELGPTPRASGTPTFWEPVLDSY